MGALPRCPRHGEARDYSSPDLSVVTLFAMLTDDRARTKAGGGELVLVEVELGTFATMIDASQERVASALLAERPEHGRP